jgi:6-carboxyhexanoate--CoA ligase
VYRYNHLIMNLISIRMRASKKIGSRQNEADREKEMHVSGAEGLYEDRDVQKVVKKYIERAINHPKGRADKIIITIEETGHEPKEIPALPVATIICSAPSEAGNIIMRLLQSSGISRKAVDAAFRSIRRGNMRGAALVSAEKGIRLDPDIERGVRVSRLGIGKEALKLLSSRLSRYGINNDTVKEALVLASKVASDADVIAELCISDDPYYTTGYIASQKFGYMRIPNIKRKGSKIGGRAFFVDEGANTGKIMRYLERDPVLICKAALCKGPISIDEILSSPYQ